MVIPGDLARTSGGEARRCNGEYPACGLYRPGHLVHRSQARKAWESDDPVRWGRSEGVHDGRLVVRFLDGTERYRVHRPAEVERVAQAGDKVRVSERWRVASLSRRFEHLVTVSIALADDPWRPCSVAPRAPSSVEGLALHPDGDLGEVS